MALDQKKFESQQARRILDRLVGYEISPVLWTKVRRGLSAGRVQSVAVRLVVEREDEIKAFVPQEYWTVEATVEGPSPPPFNVKATKLDGKKLEMVHEGQAREVVDIMRAAALRVSSVERKERRKNPPPPLITSMRTDSTRLSDDAVTEVRAYVGNKYGPTFLPAEPVVYKTKKSAQDAHEAIRPTGLKLSLIHISEPTRLLSISYAVFCLKKKKKKRQMLH